MKAYFPVAVALLVGAALGYCLAPSGGAPAEGKAKEPVAAPSVKDEGDKASVNALRARIRHLEGLLAKGGGESEKVQEEPGERARPERRFDPRAEMERMKNEDPVRYAQITNGMARFRRRMLDRAQSNLDFLGSIDTSGMSEEARRTHDELQSAIERREQIAERMQNFMDMTDEERRAAHEEMREANRQIHELGMAERDNLLTQTAEALGFEGDAAAEIVDTVKGIYEATESHGFGPRAARGGRRGR